MQTMGHQPEPFPEMKSADLIELDLQGSALFQTEPSHHLVACAGQETLACVRLGLLVAEGLGNATDLCAHASCNNNATSAALGHRGR